MSEMESFVGKPNLKEWDFCELGQQFKVSNWYDLTAGEGGAQVEQNGACLAQDDRMSHDMREPFFDLEVVVDQQKHKFQVYFFGVLSPQIQCRLDDSVVFGPQSLPTYVSLLGAIHPVMTRFLFPPKREGKGSPTSKVVNTLSRIIRLAIIFFVFYFGTGLVLDLFF